MAIEVTLFVVVIIGFSVFILKSAVSFFSSLVPAVAISISIVAISFVSLLPPFVLSFWGRGRWWWLIDHFIHNGAVVVQHHFEIF